MKSIDEIEQEARKSFEKQTWVDKDTSFYPFFSGWIQSEYNNIYHTAKKEIETTTLEMENYISAHCEELKSKGLDDIFIQNTRSSMQHTVVMMRYFMIEKFQKI